MWLQMPVFPPPLPDLSTEDTPPGDSEGRRGLVATHGVVILALELVDFGHARSGRQL